MHAYVPAPVLQFDDFVNIGTVVQGNTAAKVIEIRNVGTEEGTFFFEFDNSLPLKIEPSSATLAPPKAHRDAAAEDRVLRGISAGDDGGRAAAFDPELDAVLNRDSIKVKIEFQGTDLGVFRE